MSERAKVALATSEPGYLTAAAQSQGIDVHLVRNLVHPIRPIRDIAAIRELRALLLTVQPDLLHCHSSKAGLVGRVAAKMAGIPCVFTAHGWEFAPGLSWKRRAVVWPAEWLAARTGGHIISVSRTDYDLAVKSKVAKSEQMSIVRNGIEDDDRRADPAGVAEGGVVITMVARLAPPKDPMSLLEALKGVPQAWKLRLVGDGPLRGQLEAYVRAGNLSHRVEFLGEREDIPEILASSQVFVLISRKEGMPITIIEAMRAGLPVIASNVGGIPEQITDGETGYLVPRGDIQTLRSRLSELLSNACKRDRMGRAARNHYTEYFSSERMISETLNVYTRVLATR